MTEKNAKVLAIYFGRRRNGATKEMLIDNLKEQIESTIKFDCGCHRDLLLVNHNIGNQDMNMLLDSYNNSPIKNGIIRVLHRPFIDADFGFGSFKYAFNKLKNEYDYWFFSEDDVFEIKDNLFNEMISIIKNDSQIGFVAALNMSPVHPYTVEQDTNFITAVRGLEAHAHSDTGVTSTTVLNDLYQKNPNFFDVNDGDTIVHIENELYYGRAERFEIDFTNTIAKSGYKLYTYSLDCNVGEGLSFIKK